MATMISGWVCSGNRRDRSSHTQLPFASQFILFEIEIALAVQCMEDTQLSRIHSAVVIVEVVKLVLQSISTHLRYCSSVHFADIKLPG
jgi:hypothetical protein